MIDPDPLTADWAKPVESQEPERESAGPPVVAAPTSDQIRLLRALGLHVRPSAPAGRLPWEPGPA